MNIDHQILGDLVSKYFQNYLFFKADKPMMQPRKDYEDYSRFINDTFHDEKINMLS